MIISIDGPAGSGKSTVAHLLSKKLRFIHFNSGSLFRAVAVFLKENGYNFSHLTPECDMPKFNFKVEFKKDEMRVFVNDLNCTAHLRDNDISIFTASVSTNKHVRFQIDEFQRNFVKQHNVVVDGRDIGSHVFPDAEVKFYLDCSLTERAKRRFTEEQKKGNKIALKDVELQLAERDEIDKHKKYAPLVIPNGAIIIDSTNLTINQVLEQMLKHIKI